MGVPEELRNNQKSFYLSQLFTAINGGSRGLNPYIEAIPVKLETLSEGERVVQVGDYQTKTDLASAYWHIPVCEKHQELLGIHYEHEDGTRDFWVMKILFLGSRDAVRWCTKVTRPHRAYLHRHGIRHNMLIDDQRTLAQTKDLCRQQNKICHGDLSKGRMDLE